MSFAEEHDAASERILAPLGAKRATVELPASKILRDAAETGFDIPQSMCTNLYDQRDPAWIAKWVQKVVAGLRRGPRVHVALNEGAWWTIDAPRAGWLETIVLSRDDAAPRGHGSSPVRSSWGRGCEDLVVLSADGSRTLVLETVEDQVNAYMLETADLLERHASIERLVASASRIDGITVQRPGMWSDGPALVLASLRDHEPIRTWSGTRSDNIDRGYAALVAAFLEKAPGELVHLAYIVSCTRHGPLAWRTIVAPPGHAWLEQLAAMHELLVVVDRAHAVTLVIEPDSARLYDTRSIKLR